MKNEKKKEMKKKKVVGLLNFESLSKRGKKGGISSFFLSSPSVLSVLSIFPSP